MNLHLPSVPVPSKDSSSSSPSSSESLSLLFRTFDETLLHHLTSLIPRRDAASAGGVHPAISLTYLSDAVAVLSTVHSVADQIVSDPSLSGSDEATLSSYLDTSVKLLDACNAISAEIERLLCGRLLLLFAVHLLSSSPSSPEKIRKARESIREWEDQIRKVPGGVSAGSGGLIHHPVQPSGKMTAVGRAIYAVEAVSALVAGSVITFFGGEVDLAGSAKISGDFAWGEAYNGLQEELSGEIRRLCPGDAVEACVRRLAVAIDGVAVADGGEKAESLRGAVKELEGATEMLAEGLHRLRGAVNGLFRAAISTRNTVLYNFRVVPKNCK